MTDVSTPAVDLPASTGLAGYVAWLSARGRDFSSYDGLWRWSVADVEGFWASLWDYFEIPGSYGTVLESRDMPGARWFPGAQVNYATHMLGGPDDTDRLAVLAYSQTREPTSLTFGELADRVGRARAGLRRLGVGRGDRVVAYLPNIPETLVAFL
ncbi:MAG: acetyl-coenzyme A synthetase N-terminal domain-containing protein, partial [Nocardioidaceae bacterium]